MSLEKHQEIMLRTRLDELLLTGTTLITWQEMSHWFNVERIAKRPYREIHEMWQETCTRRGFNVLTLEVRGIGPNSGGIRLIRPYNSYLDGEQHRLDDLII